MSVKRHSLDDIGLDRENREHFKKHKNAKWPSCLSSEVPYVKSDCNGGLHQRSNSERKRPANRMSLNKVKKKFLGKAVSESKGCVDEAELKNCVPKLLITSLPRTVNSTALKNAFPLAIRLKIHKKAGMRHAFLDFTSTEDYSDTVKLLESVEFHGVKPSYRTIVGHTENVITSKHSKKFLNNPNCLRIRNLPYSLTVNEIKKEFPMVIHVHLDVNKSGIFNGSCILELKNREDMQVVLDNCKHKYIGGRLIRADVCHESKFKPDKPIHSSVVYGLKLRDVPCVISDDQIRGLFPEKSLTGLSSKLGSDSATTRNVFIFFKKNAHRKSALKMFKKEVIMGYPISCRLWVAANQRRNCRKKERSISITPSTMNSNSNIPGRREEKPNSDLHGNVSTTSKKHIVFDSDIPGRREEKPNSDLHGNVSTTSKKHIVFDSDIPGRREEKPNSDLHGNVSTTSKKHIVFDSDIPGRREEKPNSDLHGNVSTTSKKHIVFDSDYE